MSRSNSSSMMNRYFFYYPQADIRGNYHFPAKVEDGTGYRFDENEREWVEDSRAVEWASKGDVWCSYYSDEETLMRIHSMI